MSEITYSTTYADGSVYRPTCPHCGRLHHNGAFINGVDVYRCLGCGETFLRQHPDPEIDAGVQRDVAEGHAVDVRAGVQECSCRSSH